MLRPSPFALCPLPLPLCSLLFALRNPAVPSFRYSIFPPLLVRAGLELTAALTFWRIISRNQCFSVHEFARLCYL